MNSHVQKCWEFLNRQRMTLLHGVFHGVSESVIYLFISNVHLRSHLSIRVTLVAMYTLQLIIVSIGEIHSTVHCLWRHACTQQPNTI